MSLYNPIATLPMDKQQEKILKAYLSYIESHNERPASVLLFAQSIKLTEADIYTYYGTWGALEADLFKSFMTEAISALEKSKEFEGFSSREKTLSFFFTWIGKMQEHRSLVKFVDNQDPILCLGQDYLKSTKPEFIPFARKIIKTGIEQDEIADRWLVTRTYRQVLWGKAVAIYNFWLRDGSANFEKTDAFIEKSINFWFDLIQPNALDSGFDLAKFVVKGK